MKENVRVAVAQVHVEPWAEDRNLIKVLQYMRMAAKQGADVVVFSEAISNGYVFKDTEEALRAATTTDGEFVTAVRSLASELKIWTSFGILERTKAKDGIHNTALLVSDSGKLEGVYRKTFFIRSDKIWMKHGEIKFEPTTTPLGSIGMVICADMRIPEPARCTALGGAQMLFNVSNWGGPDQYEIHAPARAIENHCWIISADKVGSEPGIRYPGHSQVLTPDGAVAAEASEFDEELLVVDVKPSLADRRGKEHRFARRRPELYQKLVGLAPAKSRTNSQLTSVSGVYAAAAQVVSGNIEQAVVECEKIFLLDEADLIVLPELFPVQGGVSNENVRERIGLTETAVDLLAKFSRRTGTVVVVGLPRLSADGGLYNSACVIDGGEIVGWYDKSHLESSEVGLFSAGRDLGLFNTRIGLLGVMLGEEGLITEVPRLLAFDGAQVIAWPTRWKSTRHSDVLPLERALENQVYVVAATPAERGVGHSQVVSPRPYPIPAQRATIGPGRVGCAGHMIVPATSTMKLVSRNTDIFAHRQPQGYSILTTQTGEGAQ